MLQEVYTKNITVPYYMLSVALELYAKQTKFLPLWSHLVAEAINYKLQKTL